MATLEKNNWQEIAVLVLRVVFGGMLIYAAWDKILQPHTFAHSVMLYEVVGARASRWIAIWLPWLELVTGVFLILGIWLRASAQANILMMIVFLIAVSQAFYRGLDIDCGCFSSEGETKITSGKLLQNALLLAGSIVLFMWSKTAERWQLLRG